MIRARHIAALGLVLCAGACNVVDPGVVDPPIETGFAFTNLSTQFYAALGIRAHGSADDYLLTSLLPPGATQRSRFLDTLQERCPDSLDLRVFLYARMNDDVPIGLDEGEAVEPQPLAAGEILDLPACGGQTLETYTIVNWDAPRGEARVKYAQNTLIDAALSSSGFFGDAEAVWSFGGANTELAEAAPPALAEMSPINGRVVDADGVGIEGVGVLLRSRFRLRLSDGDASNDPDAGFTAPIALSATDSDGAFFFERPAGAYRVEVFADDLAFRPPTVDVETPQQAVLIVAEPLP